MLRVRNLDELSLAKIVGFSYSPPVARTYTLFPSRVLGRKKVTIDNPRPLRDYRFDMIPVQKTKVYKRTSYLPSKYKGKYAKYSGKKVVTKVTRQYTKFINLRKPKRGLKVDKGVVRLNDFNVAQVLGYSTLGSLITPTLPAGWTTWNLHGPIAVGGYASPTLHTAMEIDPYDLSRSFSLIPAYAETALTRASAKVTAPDVDFAEIVGELHQTVDLCKDPFKTLGALLRKFQRYSHADAWIANPRFLPALGKFANPKRLAFNTLDVPTLLAGPSSLLTFRTRRKVGRRKVSKAVVDEATTRWLQYRYGVAPLMSDITVILEKFQEKIKPLVKIYTAKSTVVSTRSVKTWEETRPSIVPGFTITYRYTVSVFDRTTAKVYYRLNVLDKYVDLQDLGLDSSNIIPVMHELGPWSFVVDWFYGIGDWLRTWNYDPKIDIVANCVSRKRDINVRIEVVKATYYGYVCPKPQSNFYLHRAELSRLVNQPVPEYPVFNPDFLKWRRVLDTISLLWQKMPNIRR